VITDVQAAAEAIGQQLEALTATTRRDIGPAFRDAGGLLKKLRS
jgi:hypothetical protein